MVKFLLNLNKRTFSILFFFFFIIEISFSQGLYIGSGGEFYLKNGTNFTTSNTIVEIDANGLFEIEGGSDWGSLTEYVNGKVTALGTGQTKLPVGDNSVYAPVQINHNGNVSAKYFNTTPASGSNGVDVDAVADIEYWEISGSGILTLPWNDNSGIETLVNNNGGKLSSVAIVGYDNGIWDLVSATQTNIVNGDVQNGDVTSDPNNDVNFDGFSQFTFGIDHQAVLSINELFLNNGISIVSNPVKQGENIKFISENDMSNLQITLFDMMGRTIKNYDNVKTYGRIGTLNKPNLPHGVYLLRFEFEGKQGVKKIIIE